ncbi:MAG: GldM family protein [Weeksellaceae bacterium]
MAFVNQRTKLKIKKSELENLRIDALIPDFDYRLSFKVMDFEVVIPRKVQIRIKGNQFSPEILKKLNKLKTGSQIIIKDIRIIAVEGYYSEDKNFESANQIGIDLK